LLLATIQNICPKVIMPDCRSKRPEMPTLARRTERMNQSLDYFNRRDRKELKEENHFMES
jgi:hypothetical protein